MAKMGACMLPKFQQQKDDSIYHILMNQNSSLYIISSISYKPIHSDVDLHVIYKLHVKPYKDYKCCPLYLVNIFDPSIITMLDIINYCYCII